jgi:hypothetical protein
MVSKEIGTGKASIVVRREYYVSSRKVRYPPSASSSELSGESINYAFWAPVVFVQSSIEGLLHVDHWVFLSKNTSLIDLVRDR